MVSRRRTTLARADIDWRILMAKTRETARGGLGRSISPHLVALLAAVCLFAQSCMPMPKYLSRKIEPLIESKHPVADIETGCQTMRMDDLVAGWIISVAFRQFCRFSADLGYGAARGLDAHMQDAVSGKFGRRR